VTISPEANRFTVDTQQTVDAYITLLTIRDVEVSDAGKYKIVAKNEVGEVTMTVSLIVKGKLIQNSKDCALMFFSYFIQKSLRRLISEKH
jgi:hypothetical protein